MGARPEALAGAGTRQQLANLMTYMDGKTGAEELIAKVIKDEALLQSLAAARKPTVEGQ